MTHIISKSSFIRGCQCHKNLYMHINHGELRDPMSEAKKVQLEFGTSSGVLAQQLYPGGVSMRDVYGQDIRRAVEHTASLMAIKSDVIYEATFSGNNLLAYVDILVRDGDNWCIFEVKSSTEIKDNYIWDCAFQYHLLTLCGVNVSDVSVVHINNKYVRQGALNIRELFKAVSVIEEVKAIQNAVAENIRLQFDMLSKKDIPAIDIGLHCYNPYTCDFMEHCWKHIPENSVFELANLKADKKVALYNSGILAIKDIPDNYKLTSGQKKQVDGVKYNKSHFEKEHIRAFLNEIKYPLFFMDFETINPGIPLFNKNRPFQKIPFQYSLHYKESKEKKVVHKEFLADAIPDKDPREDFILRLLADTEKQGQVLVYNQNFEITCLREIARDFPLYNIEIHRLIDRIVDLMVPFQKKYKYKPEMKGSYSIKYVLPAMVNHTGYKNLEIGEGGAAMRAFEQLYYEKDPEVICKTRQNLLEYCKLDTYAMVLLLEKLQSLTF